jgi:hypothetical protein
MQHRVFGNHCLIIIDEDNGFYVVHAISSKGFASAMAHSASCAELQQDGHWPRRLSLSRGALECSKEVESSVGSRYRQIANLALFEANL